MARTFIAETPYEIYDFTNVTPFEENVTKVEKELRLLNLPNYVDITHNL